MDPPIYSTFFTIILFFFSISFSNAITYDVIDSICNQSQDKNFCIDIFQSDRRSVAAPDLHAMALLSASITLIQVGDALNYIPELRKDITDEVGRLDVCQADYQKAETQFRAAWNSANSYNYDGVVVAVQDAKNAVTDCEDAYKKDPVAVSPIASYSQDILKLSEIILIIKDMLQKH